MCVYILCQIAQRCDAESLSKMQFMEFCLSFLFHFAGVGSFHSGRMLRWVQKCIIVILCSFCVKFVALFTLQYALAQYLYCGVSVSLRVLRRDEACIWAWKEDEKKVKDTIIGIFVTEYKQTFQHPVHKELHFSLYSFTRLPTIFSFKNSSSVHYFLQVFHSVCAIAPVEAARCSASLFNLFACTSQKKRYALCSQRCWTEIPIRRI